MTVKDDRDNFQKQLEKGEVGEVAFMNYLDSRNYELLERSQGYMPEFDFRFIGKEGTEVTAEVKSCYKDSPNLAIETWSRGKCSGVCSGKAKFYVIYSVIDNAFYIADRSELLQFLAKNPKLTRVACNKQNDSGTVLLLLKKSEFIKHFHKVSA